MDRTTFLELLSAAIPHVVAATRRLREQRPEITDAEIIAELQHNADNIVDTGTAWLDAHPSQT
jgi:hypothetical protein